MEKNQKKVNKDIGLTGSLLFEMQKSSFLDTENKVATKNRIRRTLSMDRDIKSIVHFTLKKMMTDKK